MMLSIDDIEKQMARLADRYEKAEAVLWNAAQTDQQIQVNITLLQRQQPKLERYQDYKPAENEEFDYNRDWLWLYESNSMINNDK